MISNNGSLNYDQYIKKINIVHYGCRWLLSMIGTYPERLRQVTVWAATLVQTSGRQSWLGVLGNKPLSWKWNSSRSPHRLVRDHWHHVVRFTRRASINCSQTRRLPWCSADVRRWPLVNTQTGFMENGGVGRLVRTSLLWDSESANHCEWPCCIEGSICV